jgi:hypothetical protein
MANEKKKERILITTPEFRASYPSLLKARAYEGQDPSKAKFSIEMIFQTAETEKSKKAGRKVVSLKEIKDAVAKILLAELGPDWAKKIKERRADDAPRYKIPFRDGNAEATKDKDGYGPGTEYFRASSTDMPGLVGPKAGPVNPTTGKPTSLPLEQPERELYGGCICRAIINPYWYTYKEKGVVMAEGISFGLVHVQKIRDDEPFSSRTAATESFSPMEEPAAESKSPAPSTGDPLAAGAL